MTVLESDIRTHRRKLYINISKRKLRAGTGSSREFLARRTTDVIWTDLTDTLAPIQFAVVEGVATRLYMPERVTKDIDVVIVVANAKEARKKLEQAGFAFRAELSLVRGSTWLAPNQQEIDVLEGEESWWPEAVAQAQSNRDGQGLPILPLPFLVLMKYQSGRAQDLADIERMLGQAPDSSLKATRALFQKFASGDLADLESLIELGKLSS
jgi:hypothetical protein